MSLVIIRDGVQFRPDAAASFRRMEAQLGREVSTNRTVVPFDVQADLWAQYERGEYPYKVMPPTESNHVYRTDTDGGNATDTDERGDWLDENGWIAAYPAEPWHREYHPDHDQHLHDPDPTTTTQEEPLMKLIQATIRGIAIIGPGYFKGLTPEELSIAVALYGWPTDYGDNPRAFDLAVSIALNGETPDTNKLAATAADTLAALSKLKAGE